MARMWPFGSGGEEEKVAFLQASKLAIQAIQAVGRSSTELGVASLAKLTRKPVQVAATGVSLLPAAALPGALARHHTAAVCASMSFTRDAHGFGALVLGKEDAMRLVDLLLQRDLGTTREIDALAESAVAETANIALNAMVTAAAKAAGASLATGVPTSGFDVGSKLAGEAKPSPGDDHAILLETAFTEKASGVGGTMILVFWTRAASASG